MPYEWNWKLMLENEKNSLGFLIENALKKFSHLIAYTVNEKSYTYAELDALSLNVANFLIEKATNQNYIGIYASKNFETYASILGVIRAGKAYVPLSPKFPQNRLKNIIEKSNCKIILFINGKNEINYLNTIFPDIDIITTLPNLEQSIKFEANFHDDNPAYLLFTSGTTGDPKGVSISRNQLKNYLINISKFIPLQPENKCSQTFELNFDLSVHDIFYTLLNGATLCIPEELDLLSPGSYIQKNNITHFFCVPSLLKIMDRLRQVKPETLKSVEQFIFCGEALPLFLVEKLMDVVSPRASLTNLYGPTETTIAITAYTITDPVKHLNGILSIGKIFDGNETLLIPIPEEKELAELAISGNQVIENYFENFTEKNDKFLIDEFGKQWYKTGDLVRIDEDGLLYYAGRNDDQMKWNGHRIEAGEIEHYTRLITGNNAVCFKVNLAKTEQLCLVLEGELSLSITEIRIALNKYLSPQLVPQQIVTLPIFPMNSNGKTDRKNIIEQISKQLNG
jgi:D-alanine--poly(phosphoribitol) ligase subunit 1